MSKIGLSLCGLYAAIIAACVGYAQFGGLDTKSQFIFLQIPIVLQSAAASKLGLSAMLTNLPWLPAYIIFAGPVFALLYGAGAKWDSVRNIKTRYR